MTNSSELLKPKGHFVDELKSFSNQNQIFDFYFKMQDKDVTGFKVSLSPCEQLSDIQILLDKLLEEKKLNYFSVDEFRAYLDCQANVTKFLSEFLPNNRKIEYLKLSSSIFALTYDFYPSLAESLADNCSLRSLVIKDKFLSSQKDFEALKLIVTNGKVEYLRLDFLHYFYNKKGKICLYEEYNKQVKFLCELILMPSTLKILDLSGNQFTDCAMKIISAAIEGQKIDEIIISKSYDDEAHEGGLMGDRVVEDQSEEF